MNSLPRRMIGWRVPLLLAFWCLFLMAFSAQMGDGKEDPWDKSRLYRFVSADGMNWSKGEWVYPRVRADLLDEDSGTSATYADMFSCYYDTADPALPYKAWVHFANWGEREGAYYVDSGDGRQWKRGKLILKARSARISQDGRELVGAGDVSQFYHDPVENRFLALIKFNTSRKQKNANNLRSRAYAFVDRLDQPFDVSRLDRDELIYYYGASSWGKNQPRDRLVSGGGIFRARIRPDGFISIDAGTLVTRPMKSEGGELTINSEGTIRIEVLNEAGGPLGSAEVTGDALEHPVRFGGRTLGEICGGAPFRLRFSMGPSGRLYAFRIR